MGSDLFNLDLDSDENEILLNPRWPSSDYQALYTLAEKIQTERNLRGHVWIATSGSTASSIIDTKLVAISKVALRNSAKAVNQHLQSTSADIWAQVLPHFHVGGLGIEIRAQLSGAKIIKALKPLNEDGIDGKNLLKQETRWDADFFYETLWQERCTLSALVPTQVYDLVSRALKSPPHLRAIIVGGGALDPELYKKARQLGWPLLPSYGMTETASQIATASLESLKRHFEFPSIGLLSHASAKVNDAGFLWIHATSLFTCYAQNKTEGAICWDPKDHGGFVTEDRGEVVDGSLIIEGRSKDYIKIGGEGTNLARLRLILQSCILEAKKEASLQLALLDMPSDRLGTEIHLVSLLPEKETAEVVELYSQKVLPFEKIRKIHYLKNIPHSELGKVLWEQLRSELNAQKTN